MSNKSEGLFTDSDSFNPHVNAIPLSDVDTRPKGQGSIGDLVKDATAQASSLIRSEVELAKTEIAQSGKKVGLGVGLFAAAGVIIAYSSFFLFLALAWLLDHFMPRSLAFLVVFLIMAALTAILALVGVKQLKGAKKPERTINSLGELKQLTPDKERYTEGNSVATKEPGLFT